MLYQTLQPRRDYAKFVIDPANRTVSQNHVDKLAEAIEGLYLLDLYPLVTTDENVIVDGQHRYHAAKGLQTPFYVLSGPGVTVEDIAMANENTLKYSEDDILHVYNRMGVDPYVALAKYLERNKQITLPTARKLLSDSSPGAYMSGDLVISAPNRAQRVADIVKDISDLLPKQRLPSPSYLKAFADLAINPIYDHKKMVERVSRMPMRLLPAPTAEEAMNCLDSVYNHAIRMKNRVILTYARRSRENPLDAGVTPIQSACETPIRGVSHTRKVDVFVESDLSLFRRHPSARNISPARLEMLKAAIQKKNLLPYFPIIVDNTLVVIDGQRRLEAAKTLGLPVYYIMCNNISIRMLSLAGGVTKAWALRDYLSHFCALGVPGYLELKKFFDKNKEIVGLHECLFLLAGGGGWYKPKDDFRRGMYVPRKVTEAQKHVDRLALISDRRLMKIVNFQRAISLISTRPDICNVDMLITKLNRALAGAIPIDVYQWSDLETCLAMLEKVYNYHLAESARIALTPLVHRHRKAEPTAV